jgi:hypothetical protein
LQEAQTCAACRNVSGGTLRPDPVADAKVRQSTAGDYPAQESGLTMTPTTHDIAYMACELASLADKSCADILPLIWQARDDHDEVALTARIIAMDNAVIAGRIARTVLLNLIDALDVERRALVEKLYGLTHDPQWPAWMVRLNTVEAELERLHAELAVA